MTLLPLAGLGTRPTRQANAVHAPREWRRPPLIESAPNLIAFRPHEPVVTVVYVAIGFDVVVIDRWGERTVWHEAATIGEAVAEAIAISGSMGWHLAHGDAAPWMGVGGAG